MVKNLNYLTLLLVLVFASCRKDIQQQETAEPPQAARKGTGAAPTAKTIYLQVEVLDEAGKILSDGQGPYVHGRQRVQAVIWDSGDFFMNTNTNSSRPRERWISFMGTDLPLDQLNGRGNYRMRTQNTEGDPVLIQNMPTDEPKLLGFFIWGENTPGEFVWRLRYHYNAGADGVPQEVAYSDYVQITKTEDKETDGRNVWILESIPSTPATAHLQDLVQPGSSSEGLYSIPFRFRLTEKAQ